MALAYSRMLFNKLLNKGPYIFTEDAPLIILDSKSAMCMDDTGKDTKHTGHIARKRNLLRNGEKCKIHKIDWCEEGMKLAEISNKNVGEPDLTPSMKYIMVRLDKRDKKLAQEG